jgi:hypothetical protein
VPAAALDHARRQRAGERDRGTQVDLEHPIDLLMGQVCQQPGGRQRRVRHQDVDLGGHRVGNQTIDVLAPRKVASERPPGDFLRQGLEYLRASSGQDQACAASRERAHDRLADPARRARHERVAAHQAHGWAVYPRLAEPIM